MMSITHTLKESKKIIKKGERVDDTLGSIEVLDAMLADFKNAPLTFSEMSQLGVPAEIINRLFIKSPKVPDGLKRQLANYNCAIASDYCENTDLIEKQNKTANSQDAAWRTGAYLRGSVRFAEYGGCLQIRIYKRQADYICKICDIGAIEARAA